MHSFLCQSWQVIFYFPEKDSNSKILSNLGISKLLFFRSLTESIEMIKACCEVLYKNKHAQLRATRDSGVGVRE